MEDYWDVHVDEVKIEFSTSIKITYKFPFIKWKVEEYQQYQATPPFNNGRFIISTKIFNTKQEANNYIVISKLEQ